MTSPTLLSLVALLLNYHVTALNTVLHYKKPVLLQLALLLPVSKLVLVGLLDVGLTFLFIEDGPRFASSLGTLDYRELWISFLETSLVLGREADIGGECSLWLNLGMIFGLTIFVSNFQQILEFILVELFFFWEKVSMKQLVVKNLIAHR